MRLFSQTRCTVYAYISTLYVDNIYYIHINHRVMWKYDLAYIKNSPSLGEWEKESCRQRIRRPSSKSSANCRQLPWKKNPWFGRRKINVLGSLWLRQSSTSTFFFIRFLSLLLSLSQSVRPGLAWPSLYPCEFKPLKCFAVKNQMSSILSCLSVCLYVCLSVSLPVCLPSESDTGCWDICTTMGSRRKIFPWFALLSSGTCPTIWWRYMYHSMTTDS